MNKKKSAKSIKSGVSIVALIIVLIVMSMLVGITVMSTNGVIQETNAREFASELKQIEYLVKQSKILNDNEILNFPARTILVSNLTSEQNEQMSEEIVNGATQIVLYEVDFNTIGANNTIYGKKEDENDVYVVSNTTGKVYYLKGFKWEEKIYYTLTDGLNELLSI